MATIRQVSTDGAKSCWLSEVPQGHMRFLKKFLVLLMFTLSLGLFCSEVPESLNLDDDTSNDFVEVYASPVAKESQEVRKRAEPAVRTDFTKALVSDVPAVERVAPTLSLGQDLLRLFFIQRK